MATNFTQQIYYQIVHNAMLYLRVGVENLLEDHPKSMKDNMVLACSSIQIALELSMRAFLLRSNGWDSILDRKQQGRYTEVQLESLYTTLQLKVIEFDSMKKQLKGKGVISLEKEDFENIDRFQTLRNKLVHMCCDIKDDECEQLKNDLLYYVVRIVIFMLCDGDSETRPYEQLEEMFGSDFCNRLTNDPDYKKAIEKLAAMRAANVGYCPICDGCTYDIDKDFCYMCNFNNDIDEMGRTDCRQCGKKNSVIYDRLNIHNPGNGHSMPGLCQCCEERPYIFECPICGQTHWRYWECDDASTCKDGHCVTQNRDYKSEELTEPLFRRNYSH